MASDAATDPFVIREIYQPLRVCDVCDAMDGIGYFNIGLVSGDIRPLFSGIRFWGVAYTLRCVPANRPMWTLKKTQDIVDAHRIWFDEVGLGALGFRDEIRDGHVVVTDCGSAEEVGLWGSENSLATVNAGAVGVITNGQCRDTGEVELQGTPVCAKSRGRTIIPGRIEAVERQVPIGVGGAQVRPGDIVGCDADGIVVVPQEVSAEVAKHAAAILLADMRHRAQHYAAIGRQVDETIDHEAMEARLRALGIDL